MGKGKNLIKQVLLFTALFFGFILFYLALFPTPQDQILNKKAPSFQVEHSSIGGKTFSLSDAYGKKIVLVNFWATWCPPCRKEMPFLNRTYQKFKGQDFEMVVIMEDDMKGKKEALELLETFTKKVPLDFPVYLDLKAMAAEVFGTQMLPETYIINKEGLVIYEKHGPIEGGDEEMIWELIQKEASRQ